MPRLRFPSSRPWCFATLILATICLIAAHPALAKRAPESSPATAAHAMLLMRHPAPDIEPEALAPMRWEQGAQLQFGEASGIARRYWLRQPGIGSNAAPKTVAESFLQARASVLGLDAAKLGQTLELVSEKESPSGTHFLWRQVVNGVPVYRSDIVIKVSRRGEVSSMQNNLHPGVSVLTEPAFDETRAVEMGVAAVQPTGRALGNYRAELAILPLPAGPRLAYLVDVPVEAPMGDWRVFVDARTGEVIGLEDRMVYADGTGQVFDPDPMSKMGDSSFVDASNANSAVPFPGAYDIRPLLGITLTAGVYHLDGPYARLVETESPVVAPVTATQPDSFRYQRNPTAFEDVNCYYHLDTSERYIQSLGFLNINNRVQEVDSHGLSGADNSHYVPSTKQLAFGDGGVDDAEDADVIWHEYGHSIQDNINPSWGGGQEGAMGEGFGDYWAGSYSLSLYPLFRPNFVFTWDGHNSFWPGRLLIDTAMHYPEDCCGEVHDSGTLWCSGLTDCWYQVGRTVMDRLVLDHHFALGSTATMADAANQIIQSDIDLYGGAHVSVLVARLGNWGFVDPAAFVPIITHTPLHDTENTVGPYPVVATVTTTQPLDVDSPRVRWGVGALTDSLVMTPTGNPKEYAASIPGPFSNVDVRYDIVARDVNGGQSTHPLGAPANFHVFHVGTDLTPPVITHTPIADSPSLQWPRTVLATVTDGLGVNPDSVRVDWTLNAVPHAPFYLARVGLTNNYSGAFNSAPGSVSPGDVVTYHISALDLAAVPNAGRNPASGEHSFNIIAALGVVLVLDDDELAKRPETKVVPNDEKTGSGTHLESAGTVDPASVLSANVIASIFTGLGYVVTVESAAASDTTTWPTYSFIVSSSGANTGPVASATYRTALESYVLAGHKLLVEGGEVVYDAASSPGYPTFAARVLHAGTWAADGAGNLQRLAAQAGHPIANVPNVLPATLPIAFVGYGDEDSYTPVPPAYIVYGVTNQPGNGGILVYDDNVAPQSAQIVVLGVNIKALGDLTLQTQLLQNVGAFLLATESAPDGAVSGSVTLGLESDRSGVTVTMTPGGATTLSAANGSYSFSNVYPGTYTMTATKTGWAPATRTGVVVLGGQTTFGQDFKLYPVPTSSACVSPALPIPDNNATGVTTTITVPDTFAVNDLSVQLNLTHTFVGDLVVELRHGATTVRLHNRTGGSLDNIIGTYPTTLAVDGPGTLANFTGATSAGVWTLFVSDLAGLDTGTINQWCLNLTGAPDSSVYVGVESDGIPRAAELLPVLPNPMRGSGATLRFALPHNANASLALYDIGGRRVRTLIDGARAAGVHSVVWDRRDERGHVVAPGVYLVRFTTERFQTTRRLIVLQ